MERKILSLIVEFKVAWGPKPPKWFIDIITPEMMKALKNCINISFKLDGKVFKKMSEDRNRGNTVQKILSCDDIKDQNEHKKNLRNIYIKLNQLAKCSSGQRDCLVDLGKREIRTFKPSLEFPPKIQEEICQLEKDWIKMVDNCFERAIKSRIIKEINNILVPLFFQYLKPYLGDRFPMQFHCVD